MSMLDPAALADRVKTSPHLSYLHDQFVREFRFCAGNDVGLDPITVIMIISIIVQIVIHCRERRSDEQILQDIRDIRTVPPRRLMRLRRQINRLWQEQCADQNMSMLDTDWFLESLYEVAESAEPEALQEIIKLARENA